MRAMDALLASRVIDLGDTPLADMPRDAGLTIERILRAGQGPHKPSVAAFQASI